jgi:hypothetical protein
MRQKDRELHDSLIKIARFSEEKEGRIEERKEGRIKITKKAYKT